MQVFKVSDDVVALYFLAEDMAQAEIQFRAGRHEAHNATLTCSPVSNDLQVLAQATIEQPLCMEVLRFECQLYWRRLDDQLCAMPFGNLAWRHFCRTAKRIHETLKQLDFVLLADMDDLHELAVRS